MELERLNHAVAQAVEKQQTQGGKTKICARCGNPFTPERSRRLFCSKKCAATGNQNRLNHGCSTSIIVQSEYASWASMKQRCLNPRCKAYKNYGGRGVSICERWMKFENFLADMGRKPTPQHSMERIINNGNYEPSNCKWATKSEQVNNTRRNVFIEHNGETKTATQWETSLGFKPGILLKRLNRGWPVAMAIQTPSFRS